MKEIRSSRNDAVRRYLQLREKSRLRKKRALCAVEGRREVERALKSGYEFEEVFVCTELLGPPGPVLQGLLDSVDSAAVPPALYEKMALRGSTEGILGVLRTPDHRLESLSLQTGNPLLLVAESAEKPGNLGALFRTADAAGIDGILLAEPRCDMYNPQCIRASLGGVFHMPVAIGGTPEILHFLKSKGIGVYAAALTASVPYYNVDLTGPTALVMGAEDQGLSADWLEASAARLIIPMSGIVDSLNLSVSAAVLIFEAIRQRQRI